MHISFPMKSRILNSKILLVIVATFSTLYVFGQGSVKWVNWEEAIELNKTAPRKVVVDVYTDWCGWCKKMDKATFQDEEIADYLNENFYAIRFNAETREDISLGDQVYKYVKKDGKGYHELAAKITYGRLSYPTIVFLDEELEVIQPIAGFKDPEKFTMIITYFAEDHHKTTPWKKYCMKYESSVVGKDD